MLKRRMCTLESICDKCFKKIEKLKDIYEDEDSSEEICSKCANLEESWEIDL